MKFSLIELEIQMEFFFTKTLIEDKTIFSLSFSRNHSDKCSLDSYIEWNMKSFHWKN